MGNDSGLSRGDGRRNARRAGLRELVSTDRAVCGIDLADRVQELVVCDHDGVVSARRTFRRRAWQLRPLLQWADTQARQAGFIGAVVACEPTGHRWRTVVVQCDELGLPVVCVQPLLVHREREREDYTTDRSDARDAVLIADLAAQLRCYVPERCDAAYARLRHLGARRDELIVRTGACRQQLRSLLECCWPAALQTAARPLDSLAWTAAMMVVCDRIQGGDVPGVRRRMRWSRFQAAVRRTLAELGGRRVCWRIARAVYDVLFDPVGVASQRHGAMERIGWLLADRHHRHGLLADVERRMVAVLDDLELTDLVCSIHGLSSVGAAAILAQTGDMARFASARSVVKHAGLCPRNNASGTFQGTTTISRRGRPGLRLAAWRAIWGALQSNAVYAARYEHLTTRDRNPLAAQQAHVAVAAALLRQLYVVVTTGVPWNPQIAAGVRPPRGGDLPGCMTTGGRAGQARTSLEHQTRGLSMSSPARLPKLA